MWQLVFFQHNSNLLVGWTFPLTHEEARAGDLACVEIEFILFIGKTDIVSYIYRLTDIFTHSY